jgi:hypothetical protein
MSVARSWLCSVPPSAAPTMGAEDSSG